MNGWWMVDNGVTAKATLKMKGDKITIIHSHKGGGDNGGKVHE